MRMLAVALIVVALVGIALSAFPNFGTRVGMRGNFNNTQINQQNLNQGNPSQGFGFDGVSTLLQIGLWVAVLVIAILLLREPKKK